MRNKGGDEQQGYLEETKNKYQGKKKRESSASQDRSVVGLGFLGSKEDYGLFLKGAFYKRRHNGCN